MARLPDRSSLSWQPLRPESPPIATMSSATPLEDRVACLGLEIARLARRSGDGDRMLTRVAAAIATAFEADGCVVVLPPHIHVPTGESYWFPEDLANVLDPSQQLRLWASSPLDRLTADAPPLTVESLRSLNERDREMWKRLGARSLLSVATSCQGELNGAIALWRTCPVPWSEAANTALMEVSEFVSLAVDRCVRSQTAERLREQNRIACQKTRLVDRLTQAIRISTDLPPLLEAAISTLTHTLEVRQAMAVLLTYTEPQLHGLNRHLTSRGSGMPRAKASVACHWLADWGEWNGSGSPKLSSPPQSFWLSDCAWCREAFSHAPRPLALRDGRVSSEGQTVAFDVKRFPAIAIVPLVSPQSSNSQSGTVLGFLVLQHDRPRAWNDDDLELAQFVGTQLSNAILNSQTLQQVRNLVSDRTSQLQRSLDVQAKLYEQTRRQIEQLRRLNRQKDEFLSTVHHELRTPLTKMILAVQMLRSEQLPPARQAQYLELLEQQCHQEKQLVQDLLKLQELETETPNFQLQHIYLQPLLQELAKDFETRWASKNVTLSLELPASGLYLQSDTDALRRVLDELLTNAGKYALCDTQVVCRVSHEASGRNSGEIRFSLSNVGLAIAPEDLPHVFEKFRRGRGVTEQAIAGTGLGLALVDNLVKLLQGTIEISSTPLDDRDGNLTCVTVALPQAIDLSEVC
ncbi:two-component sensor histidine kinase [Geitlerinema sp. FC II]|nr:two-component sensor histidine kinase [Geitlerinema sp. FC II]